MFSVLVIVLGSDRIAILGFGASQRQIPLVALLHVLKIPRLRLGNIGFPAVRLGRVRRSGSELARSVEGSLIILHYRPESKAAGRRSMRWLVGENQID
jgi:hypothetical protein